MKTLALMVNRLYLNKVAYYWERIKLLPLRWLKIKYRLKNTVENVFRKQDYLTKWVGFQRIKRSAMAAE